MNAPVLLHLLLECGPAAVVMVTTQLELGLRLKLLKQSCAVCSSFCSYPFVCVFFTQYVGVVKKITFFQL